MNTAARFRPPVIPPAVAVYIRAKLADLRRSRGLTAAQLSAAAGLSPAAVANIERGEYDPGLGTLCALADALGVAPRDLLPDPPKKTSKKI